LPCRAGLPGRQLSKPWIVTPIYTGTLIQFQTKKTPGRASSTGCFRGGENEVFTVWCYIFNFHANNKQTIHYSVITHILLKYLQQSSSKIFPDGYFFLGILTCLGIFYPLLNHVIIAKMFPSFFQNRTTCSPAVMEYCLP
jgi:hypothetical protein